MTDDLPRRLHRALVEALRERGHSPADSVKVFEIYEELVPYQAVRARLGLDLNADYEHALLRLLAGEGDLLSLAPAQARDELRREVEAPYPFVGLFRKYSTAEVRVRMDVEDSGTQPDPSAEEPVGAGGDESTVELELGAGPDHLRAVGESEPVPARPPVHLHGSGPDEPKGSEEAPPRVCSFCAGELPPGRRVRFCPFCGSDQKLRRCPGCEAVIERGWRYCISCGHEVVEA